jgi:hypothetical protein
MVGFLTNLERRLQMLKEISDGILGGNGMAHHQMKLVVEVSALTHASPTSQRLRCRLYSGFCPFSVQPWSVL